MSNRFLSFAQRTNLLRVLTLYLSAAFVALQLVDMFADRLPVPAWLFPATLVLLAIGLPITVLAAVSYARKRAIPSPAAATRPHSTDEAHHPLTWQRVGLIVLFIFALWGLVAAAWLVIGPTKGQQAKSHVPTGWLVVQAAPEGAALAVRAVEPVDSFDTRKSISLNEGAREEFPVGEYLVSATAPGYGSLERLVRVAHDSDAVVTMQLTTADTIANKMVAVNNGASPFLIDRFEVTNEDYLEFMRAGGYNTPELRKFVDKTGTPGPRGWSGGIYPEGAAKKPVVGVSWLEATAYAKWRGKQLPTWEQWWNAALKPGSVYPWGSDTKSLSRRANFNLEGPSDVGTYPLGISWVGAYDMAGNVREWLRDSHGEVNKRIAVGGSWQDPNYLFDPQWVEGFADGFASEIIGFRCVRELK